MGAGAGPTMDSYQVGRCGQRLALWLVGVQQHPCLPVETSHPDLDVVAQFRVIDHPNDLETRHFSTPDPVFDHRLDSHAPTQVLEPDRRLGWIHDGRCLGGYDLDQPTTVDPSDVRWRKEGDGPTDGLGGRLPIVEADGHRCLAEPYGPEHGAAQGALGVVLVGQHPQPGTVEALVAVGL